MKCALWLLAATFRPSYHHYLKSDTKFETKFEIKIAINGIKYFRKAIVLVQMVQNPIKIYSNINGFVSIILSSLILIEGLMIEELTILL